METYHKINAPYYRHLDGPNKGKLILGKWAVEEFAYLANNEWEWTEKVDGTNIRIQLQKGYDFYSSTYAGRSDNATIPMPLLEVLEAVFPTYPTWRRDLGAPAHYDRYKEIWEWMQQFEQTERITLFGEGYGPKIQGGGKYRNDHSFVLFDVKIGNWWLKREDVNDIAEKLGIESVPVIGTGTLYEAIDFVSGQSRDVCGGLIDKGPMPSTWGDFTAEGLVIRPKVALFTRRGERIITKIKTRDF